MANKYSTFETIQARIPLELRELQEIEENIQDFYHLHDINSLWQAFNEEFANQTDLLFLVFKPNLKSE